MISLNTLITYALFTIIPGLLGIIWKVFNQKINELNKRVTELEKTSHQLTKDDIRQIIKEELVRFELALINKGRLDPEGK